MTGPLDHPISVDTSGRLATADLDEHVRDLIRQLLLTSPGERVNRPDFGCGLLQMVFEPNNPALAAATRFRVQGTLERWLADVAVVREVNISSRKERLEVEVVYSHRGESRRRRETVDVTGPGGGAP